MRGGMNKKCPRDKTNTRMGVLVVCYLQPVQTDRDIDIDQLVVEIPCHNRVLNLGL